ncbi:MAG: hypothetical protein WD009_12875 [Phycisphaeraceae bacterium]
MGKKKAATSKEIGGNSSNRDEELALREREWCHQVIVHRENITFAQQRWVFAFIAAVVIGVLTRDVPPGLGVLAIGTLALLGWISDGVQRVPADVAIKRAGSIEEFLRSPQSYYGGPQLSGQIAASGGRSQIYELLGKPRVFSPYLLVCLPATAIVLIHFCLQAYQ